jgi:hypothetical protein
MHPQSEVEAAINPLALDRVIESILSARQAGRSVVTLVDVTEETALAPGTVEAVMTQLETDAETPVRRATADQLRWHIRQ